MSEEEIVFTIRLTADDWDTGVRAWRCPAVDIPSAIIKRAYDTTGELLATDYLKIDKGPARISWTGPGKQPTQISIVVGLEEELSPASSQRFWKRLAIVVPIITAVIGALATWVSAPSPKPNPGPSTHTLRLRVDPNENDGSGWPPARITVNNQEMRQPIDYKIDSDVIAIVDVSKAIDLAKTLGEAVKKQTSAIQSSVGTIDTVFKQVDVLQSTINGNICSGGAHGQPPSDTSGLNAQTAAISNKLRGVNSELGVAIANSIRVIP